jgi:hypothetical protein
MDINIEAERKAAFEEYCHAMANGPEPDFTTWAYADSDVESMYLSFCGGAAWQAHAALAAPQQEPVADIPLKKVSPEVYEKVAEHYLAAGGVQEIYEPAAPVLSDEEIQAIRDLRDFASTAECHDYTPENYRTSISRVNALLAKATK